MSKGGGERAADAADEAHRSWARKEPFWDTHAAERRWAERARKEGVGGVGGVRGLCNTRNSSRVFP